MLAFGAALIIAGNLGDLLGRKRVFLLGIGLLRRRPAWPAGVARAPPS